MSLGAGPQARLLRIARTTIAPYARRHGYELHLGTELPDTSRAPMWAKVVALQRLQERYDALVWLDADLMVVDPRRDVLDELAPGTFLGLVEHRLRDGGVGLNTGVMVLRTGSECTAFLDAVWAQDEFADVLWHEQSAMSRLLGYTEQPMARGPSTPWRERTTLLDPRWNVIHDAPAPRPHRIRHYPGYKVRTRAAFMLRDLLVARR